MIFTDRSRCLAFFNCPMKRFLQYHYQGLGLSYAGTSIPLATGTHAHGAIEEILLWHLANNGEVPTSEVVRLAVENAKQQYFEDIAARGFSNAEDEARTEEIVNEQTTLISGLVWAWASYVLPPFLENFTVLAVEQEMEAILHCDCGLSGVGEVLDHKVRGCNAVVLMTRPDIAARKQISDALSYIEIKTGGKIESRTYDGDVQFAFGAAGMKGYFDEDLKASYVHALVKGYRKNGYDKETRTYSLPPQQASSLCYAYYRAGNPPMLKEDIKFKYGKGVTKAHVKTPVWEIAFHDKPEGLSRAEHYVSLMSDDELESHVNVFGPFDYPAYQVEETMEDVYHFETRNEEVFSYMDDICNDKGFGDDFVQSEMRQFVPRSWDCKKWNHLCEFYPICMKRQGWEAPELCKGFEPRIPNHPIEVERFSTEEVNEPTNL